MEKHRMFMIKKEISIWKGMYHLCDISTNAIGISDMKERQGSLYQEEIIMDVISSYLKTEKENGLRSCMWDMIARYLVAIKVACRQF
ncbi:hypothetical protein CEXT_741081 [Caerostris extrusa]|uniref:Uncharacterized protein n=1 Tax=Caerostris extrusa TaxID=172846 RepID=A0AAV4SWH1_CAEEX|nr:hypothetical protein CEXT_741081 [Caerostris extrusa]